MGFPGGSGVRNLPAKAGDARNVGWIQGWGRSPGEGHGNPLQNACQENPLGRGAWRATVHSVAKSQTWLSARVRAHTHTHTHTHMHTILKNSLKFCIYHVTHIKSIGCVLSLRILAQNLLLYPAKNNSFNHYNFWK